MKKIIKNSLCLGLLLSSISIPSIKAMDDIYFTLAGIASNSYQEVIEKEKQSQILLKLSQIKPKSEKEKLQILYTTQEALDNGADINVQTTGRENYNCLHYAVNNSFSELAELLIKKNIIINRADSYHGFTPLHVAIKNQNPIIAELLLDAGAHVDIQDTNGQTALHCAVIGGVLKTAQLLITREASMHIQDKVGYAPLHYALHPSKMTELLINAGADVNVQTRDNRQTLLHTAGNLNSWQPISTLLIESGADPSLRDENDLTPAQTSTDPVFQGYLTAAENEYQWNVRNTQCPTGPNVSENKSSFLLRAYLGAAPLQVIINNNTYLIDLYTIYKAYCKDNNKVDELKELVKGCNFAKYRKEQKTTFIKLGLPLKKDQLHMQNNLINQATGDDKLSDIVIFTKNN